MATAAAAPTRLQAVRAVLVTSDETTVVFLRVVNDACVNPFIFKVLDARNLLVRAESLPYIREKLRERLMETVFDGDETSEQPLAAAPTL